MRAAGAERGDDHAIHINQTNVEGVRVIGVIGVVGVIAFAVVGGVIKVVDGHRTVSEIEFQRQKTRTQSLQFERIDIGVAAELAHDRLVQAQRVGRHNGVVAF